MHVLVVKLERDGPSPDCSITMHSWPIRSAPMRVLSFRVLQVALRSQVNFLRIYSLRRHASPAQSRSRALHRLRLRTRLLVAQYAASGLATNRTPRHWPHPAQDRPTSSAPSFACKSARSGLRAGCPGGTRPLRLPHGRTSTFRPRNWNRPKVRPPPPRSSAGGSSCTRQRTRDRCPLPT